MNTVPLLYFTTGGADVPPYAYGPDRQITRKTPADGPEGLLGELFTPCRMLCDLAYLPAAQHWQELPAANGKGRFFIGVSTTVNLAPADVARDEQRQGHPVTLGDGQSWHIPTARLCLGGTHLPKRRVIRADGSRAWEVEAEYRDLCDFCDRAWLWRQGDGPAITYDELDEVCGRALAINYRLGMREAVLLGLFTDAGMLAILDALLDVPTLQSIVTAEHKKKDTPAG